MHAMAVPAGCNVSIDPAAYCKSITKALPQ